MQNDILKTDMCRKRTTNKTNIHMFSNNSQKPFPFLGVERLTVAEMGKKQNTPEFQPMLLCCLRKINVHLRINLVVKFNY